MMLIKTSILKTRLHFIALFLFLAAIVFATSCSPSPEVIKLQGATMGTTYHITIDSPSDRLSSDILQQQVDIELKKINQLMSTYIADSELSRFNQAPINDWFSLSAETFKVVRYSLTLSAQTEGQFDITIGPLINLWGFGAKGEQALPNEALIAAAKQQVGWQFLMLDEQHQKIKKTRPVAINLSAVAKGYGVDHIANVLDEQGVEHYLVEIGGEIRVKGLNKNQQPWKIGIETPSLWQSGVQKVVALNNKAVATSGDYRNFFEKEGVKYSHTIDPVTGKPVTHSIASLTVIHDSAMQADALATAFNVMGPDKALSMAKVYNIPLYIILYDGDDYKTLVSPSFKPYLAVIPQ